MDESGAVQPHLLNVFWLLIIVLVSCRVLGMFIALTSWKHSREIRTGMALQSCQKLKQPR